MKKRKRKIKKAVKNSFFTAFLYTIGKEGVKDENTD